ncbi:hypothetical protein NQD34_009219 [Periophthalmus magnuspinnatus]|nr:hypothetical protein NQD34_009219 [Periophthalmus magnuspinnatus]
MELSENPGDHSGPKDHSSATNPLTTRGRKRERTALTTPVGGSTFRDWSKELIMNFKKPRCLTPVGGSTFRDRSKQRLINFKKSRRLQKRRRRVKVTSRGKAPSADNISVIKTTTPTLLVLMRPDEDNHLLPLLWTSLPPDLPPPDLPPPGP